MRLPRTSVLRVMVGIGAIAMWLWLIRMNTILTLSGSLVIALSLHAANRRSRLTAEFKTQVERGRTLTFAGMIGYSIAVCLGLAWVVSVLVWDSFEHGGR